ncbi:MAG: S-layer homology domain-containing protein, partial [Vicinamibacteria bacterium]
VTAVALTSSTCAPKRSYVSHPVSDWDVVEQMALQAPADLSSSQKSAFDRGWRSLQEGRLGVAVSDLENLSRRYGSSPEIATAAGFLDLRLGNADDAERKFQAALKENPAFGPAQSGYFLIALQSGDEERAFARLARLEEEFPQHELVGRYATTLRVNVAEARLGLAREHMREKRYSEAAAAYLKALEVAPEAGSLYLEAAEAELEAGYSDRAFQHARRAAELEPSNADAQRVLGEASYRNGDLASAKDALATAVSLRPQDTELRSQLERVDAELRETNLPAEYAEIGGATRLTREQLAALLYVELKAAFDAASPRESVIAVDVNESWAADYIIKTLAAGVLEVYSNHMFQPSGFVDRIQLARALTRALQNLAPEAYDEAVPATAARDFPDVSREYAYYDAAALSVSLG